MRAIKDIVDLAKDLESRAKERRDIEVLRQIHSLAFSLQSQQAEIVERDIRVMQENANLVSENAQLKRELSEANAEDVRIHHMVEFHCGKRTGGKWMAFCPKCEMPVGGEWVTAGRPMAYCSASCGWSVNLPMSLDEVTKELTNKDIASSNAK